MSTILIGAKQKVLLKDPRLGELQLKNGEIARIDEKWKDNDYFMKLEKSGWVVYYANDTSKNVEEQDKKAKVRRVETEEKTVDEIEKENVIKEAERSAREVARLQGYDEVKTDDLIKQYKDEALTNFENSNKKKSKK